MRLLLDTHIWLWSLDDPKRLGKTVLRELSDPRNEIWLSPVSTWEALTLNAKKRIELPQDLRSWMVESTTSFQEAPLTHEIALAARQLRFSHKDPADRFLAATAQLLRLTLVTGDMNLLGLGDISTLSNR